MISARYAFVGIFFKARKAAIVAIWLLAFPAFAHSPFDCSATVIVHADSAEVMVTAGTDLAVKLLSSTAVNPQTLNRAGRPVALPVQLAAGFFEVAAEGNVLSPEQMDVATDGLEFQFRTVYPLTSAKALRLRANFLPVLSAPHACALICGDENRNIYGTAILTPASDTADFALPANLFPEVVVANSVKPPVTPVETNNAPEAASPPPVSRPDIWAYLKLGIGHILTGYDHLLFLGALLLGCRRVKPMLMVVTGFTLAHSLTLALAALDLVSISSRVVEPLIAVSIMFVAAENLRHEDRLWHRHALTCGFGLIHGFGFAGALRETGLAAGGAGLAMPLFSFNLGVEIGQLAVAALFVPVLFGLRRWPAFERHGTRVLSVLVMLVAAYWVWMRITISGD